MMDWQPEFDVELAESYAGVYGDSFFKALLEDSFARLAKRIMRRYIDGQETIDEVLDRLEKIGQGSAEMAASPLENALGTKAAE